ncbi:MAG TPA: hypothetical protein PKO06_20745, partial [Candidatus Ozemobacteraceae bacterium]|nr:hypothetical protein [Candidatus Ozemobacteraceae bacterium]
MPHPAIRFLYHGLSRHPGVIIGIIVGAFLLSFGAFTHIEIDDDFEVGITDPQAQAARALYRQHFQHEQAILVALPIAGLTRENLLSLWDLTNELQQLPEVNRVMSILSLLRPCRKREEFERYLRDFRLRNLEELIRRDDLFRGFLVNGDLTALQILVVPDVQVDNYRHKLYKGLNGILSRHAKPGAAHVFGFPYIQERFFEFIVENNQRFLTIGFIGCAILAWFLFPDPVILLLILFAIAAPTVFTFAVYFMNGNKINLFTSPIIPFTLIISLNEIIYIISFFVAERKRDDQTYSLLHEQNFHRLIRPCLINTATTLIGFLSLSQSPSQSIRLFSLYTSLACLFSYLVTFSLIFAFLRLYKPRFSLSSHQRPKFPWLERLQKRLVFRYPIAILCITAVSIALAVPLLHSYERRNSLSDNFATDDPLLSSHAFIRDRFCGPSHLQVLVSHPNLLQTKQL